MRMTLQWTFIDKKEKSKKDRSRNMVKRERLHAEKAEGSDLTILQDCKIRKFIAEYETV